MSTFPDDPRPSSPDPSGGELGSWEPSSESGEAAEALVRDAVANVEGARDELLRSHLGGLRAFVRLRLGEGLRTKETSLDLVQSVCREVLGDLDRFEYRGEGSFRHWLFLRAEHKIRDRGRFWSREKRESARETALPGEGEAGELMGQYASFFTPSRAATAKEELDRLEAKFTQLPESQREVILLARVVGLSHREVAERMGRTPLATRTLLSRALARLATLLDDEGQEGDASTPPGPT